MVVIVLETVNVSKKSVNTTEKQERLNRQKDHEKRWIPNCDFFWVPMSSVIVRRTFLVKKKKKKNLFTEPISYKKHSNFDLIQRKSRIYQNSIES